MSCHVSQYASNAKHEDRLLGFSATLLVFIIPTHTRVVGNVWKWIHFIRNVDGVARFSRHLYRTILLTGKTRSGVALLAFNECNGRCGFHSYHYTPDDGCRQADFDCGIDSCFEHGSFSFGVYNGLLTAMGVLRHSSQLWFSVMVRLLVHCPSEQHTQPRLPPVLAHPWRFGYSQRRIEMVQWR